jgi:hypothetical protein
MDSKYTVVQSRIFFFCVVRLINVPSYLLLFFRVLVIGMWGDSIRGFFRWYPSLSFEFTRTFYFFSSKIKYWFIISGLSGNFLIR